MIYRSLFASVQPDKTICAGVIGTGRYATAVVTQSVSIPRLTVPVVADIQVEAATRAFVQAGFGTEDVVVCDSRQAALRVLEQGKRVVLADPLLMMDLPLDVVVEATGATEAGAHHALEAIRHGKHVVMVNKETDVTVGPILKHLADQNHVVYTAADGDQHGLLMGLVTWAQELGLEVLCGGKAGDAGIQYHEATETIYSRNRELTLNPDSVAAFRPIRPGQAMGAVALRATALGELSGISRDDVMELTIAANATGLRPDVDSLHAPVVRTIEIPEVLCPVEEGGILQTRGAIDMAMCLRGPNDPGMGGGVFIVVACANDYSRGILFGKGLVPNHRRSVGLIYRPYHLCGVETPISILCAGLLNVPTGTADYLPRFDLVARAERDLKAGEIIEDTNDAKAMKALIKTAQPVCDEAALPMQMIEGNPLAVDVKKGRIITGNMVVPPSESVLWSLRSQQEEQFLH